MSEYTPTTKEVRENYARSLIWPAQADPARAAFFDRWLAAHDAEVRAGVQGSAKLSENSAGVVTEEPEWEYGYTSKWGTIAASSRADAESRAADHARGIAEHRESGDLTYHGKVVMRIAASKPGEWVPVKQGDDT